MRSHLGAAADRRRGTVVNHLLQWAAGNERLERAVNTNPVVGRTVHRFVAGPELEDAVAVAVQLNADGIGGILDLLGEGVADLPGASAAAQEYIQAVEVIAERGIDSTVSLKLSQLGLMVDREACVRSLSAVLERARELGVGVEVDMEQSDIVGDTIEVFRRAAAEHPDTRLAIQACLRRTPSDLESLAPVKPRVRLVKGAYAEPLERALRAKKELTAQFQYLTDWLFARGSDPAFGTHDDACLQYAMRAAVRAGASQRDFEIQMLFGVRRDLQHSLAETGYRVRVYIPFGRAWYPYLMRRMAERPHNLVFFLRSLVGH
jgi:proline dehydrogenase